MSVVPSITIFPSTGFRIAARMSGRALSLPRMPAAPGRSRSGKPLGGRPSGEDQDTDLRVSRLDLPGAVDAVSPGQLDVH